MVGGESTGTLSHACWLGSDGVRHTGDMQGHAADKVDSHGLAGEGAHDERRACLALAVYEAEVVRDCCFLAFCCFVVQAFMGRIRVPQVATSPSKLRH